MIIMIIMAIVSIRCMIINIIISSIIRCIIIIISSSSIVISISVSIIAIDTEDWRESWSAQKKELLSGPVYSITR